MFLPGIVENPHNILKNTEFFVLSSRWEGFPNALLEAMSCGLGVISYDCDFGPRDIIRDNIDGILVTPFNIKNLSESIELLMKNSQLRKNLGDCAAEVIERFSIEKVMGMWNELIVEVCEKNHF